MKITSLLAIASAFTVLACAQSQAQVITLGSQTIVSSGGVAPGSEYLFIAGPSSLTNFSVDTSLLTIYPGSQNPTLFSVLTPPGGNPATDSFLTGFGYVTTSNAVTNQTILTFTTTAASFSLYVLDSNVNDNGSNNASFTLNANGSSATYITPEFPGTTTNQFTEFVVSGFAPGTVFSLGASSTTNTNLNLGGVTFGNVVPVPEPSTWALMAGGFSLLFFGRRLRRQSV